MQEELLARLAGLDEVSVLSRTSVERFRDTNDSIPLISKSLGADGIISKISKTTIDIISISITVTINIIIERHVVLRIVSIVWA